MQLPVGIAQGNHQLVVGPHQHPQLVQADQVDRPQLVVRQGQSGLVILETEWWGANLVDEFKSALQDQLGGPTVGPRTLLRVEVQRFDTVPGRYASLETVWRLRRPDDVAMTCRTSVQTAADNSIASLVNAHQANLRKLAEAVRGSAGRGSCSPSA